MFRKIKTRKADLFIMETWHTHICYCCKIWKLRIPRVFKDSIFQRELSNKIGYATSNVPN